MLHTKNIFHRLSSFDYYNPQFWQLSFHESKAIADTTVYLYVDVKLRVISSQGLLGCDSM